MTTPLASSVSSLSILPLVSVVMAVYNAERYIAQAVESILAQTFTDFEFLIIDDGSTDRSPDLLHAYAAQDGRIRLIHQPNRGVSKTRNQLLHSARGELIAVMDADDIALPDRLAKQVEFLCCHPDVVCVGGAHDVIDNRGRLLTCLHLPEQDAEIQQAALAGHGSICHPAALMRRSAMLAVGGYDETLRSAHDLDLWLKLGEIGRLANLAEPVLRYRIHTQSVSGTNAIAQRDEAKRACEAAWQRRGIQGQFEATEPWRPTHARSSRHQFMMQYGWWAFNSGKRQTALIYALKAIEALPSKIEGWKLLACAVLKPKPGNVVRPG
jgi:glycosyltransferase involved in cell wall biosynthesis